MRIRTYGLPIPADLDAYRLVGRDLDREGSIDLGMLQDDLFFDFEKDAAPKPAVEVKPAPEEKKEEGEPGSGSNEPGKKPEEK
jgi:hypothetical protein